MKSIKENIYKYSQDYNEKIIEFFLFVYLSFIASIYFYNYGYVFHLAIICSLFFVLLLPLLFFFGPNKQIRLESFWKKIKKFFPQQAVNIRLIHLLWLLPLLIFCVTLISSLPILWKAKNIGTSLFSIFYKTIELQLFYFLFLLLLATSGKKIINFFELRINSSAHSFLFSLGLGLIPLMIGFFLLGIFKILSPIFIFLFIFLLAFISFSELKKSLRYIWTKKIELFFQNNSNIKKYLIISFFALYIIFLFSINIKPIAVTSDDLSNYFVVPQIFSEAHAYIPLEYFSGANLGHNTEMIYAAIFSLFAGRFIIPFQLVFFALTLIGFYFLLKTLFQESYALWGVFFLITIPWNAFYASTVKVEFLLAFYCLLLIFSFFLYNNNLSKKQYLYLIGVFSGIALGIKYSAIIIMLPVALLLVYILLKQKKLLPTLPTILISIFLCLLFFSPWAIKNKLFFDNYFYPTRWGKSTQALNSFTKNEKFRQERKNEINYLRHGLKNDKLSLATPLTAIWRQSTANKIDRGDWINYGFIPLLIIPFYFFLKKDNNFRLLFSLALLSWLAWFFLEGARPWYALPTIMLLYALLPLLVLKYHLSKYFLVFSGLILASLNIYYYRHNTEYLLGELSTEEYIAASVPYSSTADYINNLSMNAGEKILILNDFRVAFINNNNKKMMVDPYLNQISFSLNQGDDFFKQELQKQNIEYIIVSSLREYFKTWPNKHGISLEEYLAKRQNNVPSIFTDMDSLDLFLQNNAKMLFADSGYALYALNAEINK